MKLLSAIGDVVLFGVMALLSFVFVHLVFFPGPTGPEYQATGMGVAMMMIFYYPFAIAGVIIGLKKYRLWKNRLFWVLLVISAFTVFARTLMNEHVDGALIATTLFAPVFTVPLWQLIMALSLGARTR